VLYWLDDRSVGAQATWEFLGRRIADVMKITELRQGLEKTFESVAARLPDPFGVLRGAKLRPGKRHETPGRPARRRRARGTGNPTTSAG
jgi:ubiquinone biosynthesis protein COQ9